ncbi:MULTISPECIES: hypothetical protein [unclassified Pseudidiomarina]|uniref:hypothetical protein n=1 Tax=Pseudidiomarina salilacus TaxID=3384452 RepID=UPI0039854034
MAALLLTLTGCSSVTDGSGAGARTPLSADTATATVQQRLQQQLAAEPAWCNVYRSDYVAAFALNVRGLSEDNATMQTQADAAFAELAQDDGDCRLPQCIIEPLQEGKLTYWCGYREDGLAGQEVNVWFAWDTLAPVR